MPVLQIYLWTEPEVCLSKYHSLEFSQEKYRYWGNHSCSGFDVVCIGVANVQPDLSSYDLVLHQEEELESCSHLRIIKQILNLFYQVGMVE